MAIGSESSGAYNHCDENVCSLTVGTDPNDCDASVKGENGDGNGGGPVAAPEFNAIGLIALVGILSVVLATTTVCRRKRR